MKWLTAALVSALFIVLGWSSPAQADTCTIIVSGTTGTVFCAGVSVGTVHLPTVEVTSPPLPRVTDTVKVPGPTIKIPGPTHTVTVQPGTAPTKTVTVTKNSQPTSLLPMTVSAPETTTGQTPPNHAMIGPATPLSTPHTKSIDIGDGKTTVVEASLGLLATLILMSMLLGMWYLGYGFGFRDADSKNAQFIQDVLDSHE